MNKEAVALLIKERDELLAKASLLNEIIAKYNTNDAMQDNNNIAIPFLSDYNPSANLIAKVQYVLKTEDRFLHVREIASMIVNLEKGTENDEDNYVKKLSPLLSRLKRENKIANFKIGNSNTNIVWGSPKWIDDNGKIKVQHMYNESALSFNKKGLDI
jgi:hypothetical protein